MAKNGKILAILAIIFGVSGMLVGGFALFQINFPGDPQEPQYVLPMARVYLGGSYDLTSTNQRLDYTHKSFDSHDAFNLVTDEFIVPEPGFYQVIAQYDIEAYDQDFFVIEIINNMFLNGTCTYTVSISTSTNYFSVAITDIINANEGDAISIYAYLWLPSGPPTRALFPGAQYTYFSIVKIN